jgi:hypothetical protein
LEFIFLAYHWAKQEGIPFAACHPGYFFDLAASGRGSFYLNYPVQSQSQEFAEGGEWQGAPPVEQAKQLDPSKRLAGGTGVKRGERPGVTGIERLEEVQDFATSAFTQDHSVGSHSQRLTQQCSQRDFSKAVGIRGARLQGDEVGVAGGEFWRIFQSQDAFRCWNFFQQLLSERGLTRSGGPADQDALALNHRLGECRKKRIACPNGGASGLRAGKSPDAEVRVGRDSRGESEVNSKTVIPGSVDKRVPGVPGASGRGKKLEYPSLVSIRRPKRCSLAGGPGKKAFPEVGSEVIRTVQTKIRPTRIFQKRRKPLGGGRSHG